MQMGASNHDTQPERHVATDPGLGVKVAPGGPPSNARTAERTDPGVAPPASMPSTLEVLTEPAPLRAPVAGVDRDAATPVAPLVRPYPERVIPIASAPLPNVRSQSDATPVPPETDGLLNGLIASENEAYFRKAKAGAQSSGEAAAAFHVEAQAVAPANLTPPPEPRVVLRRSLDMEIADAEALVGKAVPAASPLELAVTEPPAFDPAIDARAERAAEEERATRDTDPPAPVRERLAEPTVPLLPDPRSQWTDKAIAFGLAALAVGAVGIIAVRWFGGSSASPSPTEVTAPAHATAPPPVEVAPLPSIPAPPPPAAIPAPSVVNTAMSAEPAVPEAPVQRPVGRPPRVNPTTRRAPVPGGSSEPAEVTPPAKDDVKRSM
jgi:hypothetical protein